MNKYYVVYAQNCDLKLKKFNTKKDLLKFLNTFKMNYGSFDDGSDNWIQYIFKGKKCKIKKLDR